MGKVFILLLMFVLMFGLVAGAGYNVVVPTATTPPTSSSSGGGGGGGSVVGITYTVSAEQFAAGYSGKLAVNDRFKVNISNELHYVKVVGVSATTVSINVSSETQQATLAVGDTGKFDVSEDGYYDFSITLNSINATSSKADLMIKSIYEEVIEESEGVMDGGVVADTGGEVEGGRSWWVWIVVVVVIAGIVAYFWKKSRKV